MSAKQKATLEDMLRRARAARPSASEGESVEMPETPFFDQVVERAGGTENKGLEELLAEIVGPVDPLAIPQFPTPQCLTPEDVYTVDKLQPDKQVHLESCPWCKTMVGAAQPTYDEFARLLEKCRKTRAEMAESGHELAAY